MKFPDLKFMKVVYMLGETAEWWESKPWEQLKNLVKTVTLKAKQAITND